MPRILPSALALAVTLAAPPIGHAQQPQRDEPPVCLGFTFG